MVLALFLSRSLLKAGNRLIGILCPLHSLVEALISDEMAKAQHGGGEGEEYRGRGVRRRSKALNTESPPAS